VNRAGCFGGDEFIAIFQKRHDGRVLQSPQRNDGGDFRVRRGIFRRRRQGIDIADPDQPHDDRMADVSVDRMILRREFQQRRDGLSVLQFSQRHRREISHARAFVRSIVITGAASTG